MTCGRLLREGNALEGGASVRRSPVGAGTRRRGLKPGEPHGRLRDATSPRSPGRRKPSRRGGTARTERAEGWLPEAEAGSTLRENAPWRMSTEGRSLEEPCGRKLGPTPGPADARCVSERQGHAAAADVVGFPGGVEEEQGPPPARHAPCEEAGIGKDQRPEPLVLRWRFFLAKARSRPRPLRVDVLGGTPGNRPIVSRRNPSRGILDLIIA